MVGLELWAWMGLEWAAPPEARIEPAERLEMASGLSARVVAWPGSGSSTRAGEPEASCELCWLALWAPRVLPPIAPS